jgi:hypothetical protein
VARSIEQPGRQAGIQIRDNVSMYQYTSSLCDLDIGGILTNIAIFCRLLTDLKKSKMLPFLRFFSADIIICSLFLPDATESHLV